MAVAIITDRSVRNRIGQPLTRCAAGGWAVLGLQARDHARLPLSPIIGAFFLAELDAQLAKLGLFFVRSMDDIPVLAPTR